MFCTATPLPLASLLVDSCCSSGSVDVDRRACCTPGNLPNTGPLLAEPRPHCRIHYLVVRTTVHPAGLLLASIAPSSRECQCRCVGCCVPFFSRTPSALSDTLSGRSYNSSSCRTTSCFDCAVFSRMPVPLCRLLRSFFQ